MMNKIIPISYYVFMFFVFNIICRYNSCYFRKSLFKKYIIIKNEVLKILLIGEAVGRDRIVDYRDISKLSIIGLISYIIIVPFNLLNLILKISMVFNCSSILNLDKLSKSVYDVLLILIVLDFIIFFINDYIFWDK